MELNRPYPQTWRCDEFRAAALALGGLALASYAVMFAVLRLESMALLLGTLVLVGILAFLMALTAKMNR